jgi:hypothetical protein
LNARNKGKDYQAALEIGKKYATFRRGILDILCMRGRPRRGLFYLGGGPWRMAATVPVYRRVEFFDENGAIDVWRR